MGFAYTTFTFFGLLFRAVPLPVSHPISEALQPHALRRGLGCSAFARRYLRNLNCIYFPHPTEMFQFGWYPSHHYHNLSTVFMMELPSCDGTITRFGNRRIKGVWLLPDEYRCHMRPSSAQTPKASIVSFIALQRTEKPTAGFCPGVSLCFPTKKIL